MAAARYAPLLNFEPHFSLHVSLMGRRGKNTCRSMIVVFFLLFFGNIWLGRVPGSLLDGVGVVQ
jgi:hypothetical protein